jgi:uncharacterized protein YndB with AHSA1/START domain
VEKVFEIYIKTTPEELWDAITAPGGMVKFFVPPGTDLPEIPSSSEELESDRPRRLSYRMKGEWSDAVKEEPPSRITMEIEPIGSSCRLRVVHDEMREDATDELYGGWPMILSALKTRLETGEHLDTPASLRFATLAGKE